MMLCERIRIRPFTDIKNLFDIISDVSRRYENRIMLDVFVAMEGFSDISDIGFIRSSTDVSDGHTKPDVTHCIKNDTSDCSTSISSRALDIA